MADPTSELLRRCAAVLGASGVAAGAFGAHALKDTLSRKAGGPENWKTAVTYQMFHAVSLLALSALSSPGGGSGQAVIKDNPASSVNYATAGKMMMAGTLLFSGSIYCLCLEIGPKRLLGPITPIGGLLMIGGWVMTAF